MALVRYLIKRFFGLLIVVFGIVTILFLILNLTPGDPARLIAGIGATEEDVEMIRKSLGLDKPLHIRYILYISGLLRLDLGKSIRTGTPVLHEVLIRLPNTIVLAVSSMALALAIGIPLGIVAAVRTSSLLDYLIITLSIVGNSIPVFWLGLMFIVLFSVKLRLLPAGGIGTPLHLVLPSLTIAIYLLSYIIRFTRTAVLDALRQEFVRYALSKGLPRRVVLYKHVLRNALIPVLTITGLQFGALLGGAPITETVFAWPGIGKYIVDSIFAKDYPAVQGAVFIFALIYAIVNLVTDLLYVVVDPRVKLEGGGMRE
ncbi:MAG: ABC transporter permease [Thermoprotei archaeon]|nr:ABC transporter permease [Thermoprotei archaeon]